MDGTDEQAVNPSVPRNEILTSHINHLETSKDIGPKIFISGTIFTKRISFLIDTGTPYYLSDEMDRIIQKNIDDRLMEKCSMVSALPTSTEKQWQVSISCGQP